MKDRRPKQRIIIVGNGGMHRRRAGIEGFESSTAKLIGKIAKPGMRVWYVDWIVGAKGKSPIGHNRDCRNMALFGVQREPISFLTQIPSIIRLFRSAVFVYVYYPGTLGRLLLLVKQMFPRPLYGLYVRGQNFSLSGPDRLLIRRARFVNTISPSIGASLSKIAKEVVLILPELSFPWRRADVKNRAMDQKMDSCRALYVGRLEQDKGVLDLIRTAEIINDSGLRFELTLVGTGTLEKQLRQTRLAQNGLLTLTGTVSNPKDLQEHYRQAQIFIILSHHEGFPRSIWEAIQHGLPIATTMVGGISGFLEEGASCIGLPVADPERAAELVLNALQASDKLELITENARKVHDRFMLGANHHGSELNEQISKIATD
jgi:glycosyltransferase involved in cell wall biosynthesis